MTNPIAAIDALSNSPAVVEAAPGILNTAKTAVVGVAVRNPLAATLVAGTAAGVAGTLVAIKYGPSAYRLARKSVTGAVQWVGRKMSGDKPATPAEFPAKKPAAPTIDSELAA